MASSPTTANPIGIPDSARERWRLNLDALAARQPSLAESIAKIELPPSVQIVTGRDGNTVASLERDATSVHWLGGTSMPSVSVPELFREPFDPGQSVALPSVGSGYEANWLADRLHPHAAVFLCEPDVTLFAIALHVVDLSRHLRAGQIVPIVGDIQASLVAFFEQNPGYQPPVRVQKLPDVDGTAFTARVAAIQRGAQHAETAQQQLLARLAQQVKRSRTRRSTAKPRVLILSTDAVGGAIPFAAHVANSMAAAGIDAPRCLPDAPDKCQRSARLGALRDHDPDWVLLINSTPGPLRDCWPNDLPYVCWFLESAQLPPNALVGLRDCPDIRAASTAVRERLIAQGADKKTVRILEPGVDDTAFHPLKREDLPESLNCEIAVFADGCDLSPAASNIGLETHERLWTTAATVLATSLREGHTLDAETLLARAEKKTGVRLADDALRKDFRALLTARVIPTVTARLVITELAAIARTRVWGSGWHTHTDLRALVAGEAPPPIQRNRIYQSATLVIFPQRGPTATGGIFETLAAGGFPIASAFSEAELANHPQTGAILSQVLAFSEPGKLSRIVSSLRNDVKRRYEQGSALRAQLVQSHTLRDRLALLHKELTDCLI